MAVAAAGFGLGGTWALAVSTGVIFEEWSEEGVEGKCYKGIDTEEKGGGRRGRNEGAVSPNRMHCRRDHEHHRLEYRLE